LNRTDAEQTELNRQDAKNAKKTELNRRGAENAEQTEKLDRPDAKDVKNLSPQRHGGTEKRF
jgi:hypothetical protein